MWAPAAILALGLAGCNAAEPRVALPLDAAEGADPLVKDFVEICSQSLVDADAASAEAAKRGWIVQADPDAMMFGARIFNKPGLSAGDTNLQIIPTRYPHIDTRTCMAFASVDGSPPDLSVISKTAGVLGEFNPAGKDVARGVWSFIGPDGEPVAINAFVSMNRIVQMTMSTSRRAAPPQAS